MLSCKGRLEWPTCQKIPKRCLANALMPGKATSAGMAGMLTGLIYPDYEYYTTVTEWGQYPGFRHQGFGLLWGGWGEGV